MIGAAVAPSMALARVSAFSGLSTAPGASARRSCLQLESAIRHSAKHDAALELRPRTIEQSARKRTENIVGEGN
jgi:hypothetical protein